MKKNIRPNWDSNPEPQSNGSMTVSNMVTFYPLRHWDMMLVDVKIRYYTWC